MVQTRLKPPEVLDDIPNEPPMVLDSIPEESAPAVLDYIPDDPSEKFQYLNRTDPKFQAMNQEEKEQYIIDSNKAPLKGQVEKNFTPDEIKYPVKNASPEYKAEIDAIEKEGINKKIKTITGGVTKILSPLIGLGLSPFTGGMSLPASLAITGGTEGLAYGIGDTLMQDKKGVDALLNTVKEGVIGTGIGAAQGAAMKYAPKVIKALKNNKNIQELGQIATNPQKYVANIKDVPIISKSKANVTNILPDNTARYITGNINPQIAASQPPVIPPLKTNIAMMGDNPIAPINNSLIPETISGGSGNIPPIKPPVITEPASELPINTGNTIPEEYIFNGEKTGQKVRKTYKSLKDSKFGEDPEFMENIEPEKMYDTVNNADTFKQAMGLSNTEADTIIKSSDPSALRTMTNIKRLGDALDIEDQIAAQELGNLLLKRGTEQGQSIQAYSLIKKLSPEGAVLTMLKVNRDSMPKLAQNLIDNADDVINGVNNAKNEAINALSSIDDTLNKSNANIKVANPKDAWDYVVDELGKKLARKVNRHVTPEIEKTISPAEQVIKTLYSVAKEELPKLGKKAPDDLFMFVKNALQNKPLYGETYNKAQQIIATKYANDPEKLQILNKYLTELKDNPYSQDYVNKITSELQKSQNIKIKDLIKTHVSREDFTAQALKKGLMQKLGLDEKTASQFSLATQKRFYAQLDASRKKALEQYFKDAPPVQKEAMYKKIVNLSNMGALDNANYMSAISKKFKIDDLTTDDIAQAKALAEKIQTTTGRENDIAIGELKKLIGSKRKIEIGQKIKTARNINLLLSATGRGADTVSTALFQGQEALAELAAGRKLYPKEWAKGLVNGIKYGIDDVKRGIDTSRITSHDAYDLPYGRVLGDVPVYNKAEKLLNYMIRVPDRAFEEARYASSIAEQMGKTKLAKPTEEMILNAINDAKNTTFKNDSVSSNIASGLQKLGNNINYKGIGLGDFAIPFAKTLGNLGEESIKYSPLNYLTYGYDFLNGNSRSAMLNLGKANVGTGLVAGGIGLGAYNAHNGAMPDWEVKANKQAIGQQPYSFNTPMGNIQYSRIQPLSNSLAFGEGLYDGWQGGATLQDKIQGSVGGGFGSIIGNQLEQPYFKGVKTILDNMSEVNRTKGSEGKGQKIFETLGETGVNYLSQMLPFSSTANNINKANIPFVSDQYQRQVDYTNPVEVTMSRYPISSRFLPNKKNVLGENIKFNNSNVPVLSQIEGLFNPFNIENIKPNDVVEKSLALGQPLPVIKKRVKINGEMKKLSSKEVSKYQELTGKLLTEKLEQVFKEPGFNELPQEEQIKSIQNIQEDINAAIKYKLFGHKTKNGLNDYSAQYLDKIK